MTSTYFCPNGHNVFTTTEVNPECGACGAVMTTDPSQFEDVIEEIEDRGIRLAESLRVS
jgi:methanogenic corrinoid protein MtbC1